MTSQVTPPPSPNSQRSPQIPSKPSHSAIMRLFEEKNYFASDSDSGSESDDDKNKVKMPQIFTKQPKNTAAKASSESETESSTSDSAASCDSSDSEVELESDLENTTCEVVSDSEDSEGEVAADGSVSANKDFKWKRGARKQVRFQLSVDVAKDSSHTRPSDSTQPFMGMQAVLSLPSAASLSIVRPPRPRMGCSSLKV